LTSMSINCLAIDCSKACRQRPEIERARSKEQDQYVNIDYTSMRAYVIYDLPSQPNLATFASGKMCAMSAASCYDNRWMKWKTACIPVYFPFESIFAYLWRPLRSMFYSCDLLLLLFIFCALIFEAEERRPRDLLM